jgi:hypothetical protein
MYNISSKEYKFDIMSDNNKNPRSGHFGDFCCSYVGTFVVSVMLSFEELTNQIS